MNRPAADSASESQPDHGSPRVIDLALSGLGAVGGSFLRLLADQRQQLIDRYGIAFNVVAAIDSSGAVVNRAGIDPATLASHKATGRRAVDFGSITRVGTTVADVLASNVHVDVLIEAGPGNLTDGGPGLAGARDARRAGLPVVFASKAPLVLAWDELTGSGPVVGFSACVGGALPTVALLRATLRSARATKVEAALNGTSTFVLRMIEEGYEPESAIRRAQEQGIAEPDPSWDLDGWDAACKLVLLVNASLGVSARLNDVEVHGISSVTRDHLLRARGHGNRIVALATAVPEDGRWVLKVGPTELAEDHPLARMDAAEMGVVVHTDVAGRLSATSLEPDAVPSAAAVLRDVIGLFHHA